MENLPQTSDEEEVVSASNYRTLLDGMIIALGGPTDVLARRLTGVNGQDAVYCLDIMEDMIESQHKVEALVGAMGSMKYSDLAVLYRLIQELEEYFDVATKKVKAISKVLTEKVVPDKIDSDGLGNVVVKGVGRWQVAPQLQCSVKEGHKEELHKWLRETNNGSLITEGVNPSTLKAFVQGLRKDGKPVPEEHLNLYPYSKASLVKV